MAQAFRVEVYDSRIAGLFNTGRPAWKAHQAKLRRIERLAVIEAVRFQRTGEIARSHYTNLIRIGRFQARGYVGNTAWHARWKHKGTKGPIRPHGRSPMPIPRLRGALPYRAGNRLVFPVGRGFPKKSVRGQKGYPWLKIAAGKALGMGL